MLHTLRHRLGHPVETTLAFLEGKWKSGILTNLKGRLFQAPRVQKVVSRWSSEVHAEPSLDLAEPVEVESPAPAGKPSRGERPSPEAGHFMELYVVEHGIAVESGEGIPDEWRPLTEKGRRRFQRTARAFGKLGRKLDLILSSPLIRAVQTAEILAGETEPAEVAILAELDPKFDVESARNAIAARAGKAKAVAVVGHEPQLSSVLAMLAGVPREEIELESGSIVRLDVSGLADGAVADPRWWLKPKGGRKKGLPLSKKSREKRKSAESEGPSEPPANDEEQGGGS